MAITQQSIQDQAFRVAAAQASAPDASPLIDNFFITEDLFRDALTQAVREQRYRRSFALTIASGAVALPDVILPEVNTISVEGDTPTSFESYVDFYAAPSNLINYASIRNNQFLYREAGAAIGAFSGSITVTAVAIPDIPAALTTVMDIPDTLADAVSEILANKMRGI